MNEIQNPHDQFFKETMTQSGAMRDFLNFYLPAEFVRMVEPDTAERIEDSFVDEELKEHLSDFLFRVRLKNKGEAFVYILLEHKSAPDKWVALQLLRYLVRIWEKSLRENKKKLPIVFPVVFYHGKAKWKVSLKFSALLDFAGDLKQLREQLPEYSYHLCDLSEFADEDLKGEAQFQAAMRLLKYIFRAELHEKMETAFRLVMEQAPEATLNERIIVFINYLLKSRKATGKQISQVLQRIDKVKGVKIMETTIDRWMNKGLREGLQQGNQEAALRITLRLIAKRCGKIDSRTTARVSRLPTEKLEELDEALFDFQGAQDLSEWLKKNEATNKTK